MRPHLLTLFACLAAAVAVGQGPIDGYLKAESELDIALGFSATGADVFVGGDGEEFRDFPFGGQVLSAFLAYGVTDEIDLVTSVPYVVTDASSGLQDGAFFVKARVLELPFGKTADGGAGDQRLDILAALGASVPLSNYEIVAAGAIGQRAKVIQPRVVAQYNCPGFFASAVLGYNYRFDELDEARLAEIQQTRPAYLPEQPKDYVTALLRAGVPTARFYVDGWVELQHTLGGRDFVPDVAELVQAYDVGYAQVGGTIYYSEGPLLGVAVSGAAFVAARNSSRLWRASATLVIKIRP